ncbi:MAG: cupin domain-containing protein [Gammaproteobacteria bacterium]|nr:cupin domain-containing protein [Gammaproteobacteria bacterium]
MVSYSAGQKFDLSEFIPFDTEANGALSVSNDLDARIRVDYQGEGIVAGVFTQQTGSAEIDWPATEHSFVLEGEVSISYHDSGETVTYGVGDGFIIKQHTRVTWNVTSPRFAKSFCLVDGD